MGFLPVIGKGITCLIWFGGAIQIPRHVRSIRPNPTPIMNALGERGRPEATGGDRRRPEATGGDRRRPEAKPEGKTRLFNSRRKLTAQSAFAQQPHQQGGGGGP